MSLTNGYGHARDALAVPARSGPWASGEVQHLSTSIIQVEMADFHESDVTRLCALTDVRSGAPFGCAFGIAEGGGLDPETEKRIA